MSETYEFWIDGKLSNELLASFAPRDSAIDEHVTVFTRTVRDDGDFFGVIMRFQTLGLKLVGLRRLQADIPAFHADAG